MKNQRTVFSIMILGLFTLLSNPLYPQWSKAECRQYFVDWKLWSLRYNECIENLSSCETEDARRANQARNAAFSGFQSSGCMEVLSKLNEKELKAFLACPADAFFVNSTGKKIGFYQGSFINEISNASYKVDSESEYYVLPLYDAYRVEIYGTGNGQADISFMQEDGNGGYSTTYFNTIPVQNGSKYVGTIGVEGSIQSISSSTTTLTAQSKTTSSSDPIWSKINSIGQNDQSNGKETDGKQTNTSQNQYTDIGIEDNQHTNQNKQTTRNVPPRASFSMMPNNPEMGDMMVLVSTSTDPDGDLLSYEWLLDKRIIGRMDRMETEASFSGPQTITLIVTDKEGASSSTQKQINVQWPSSSGFSFDDIDEDTLIMGAIFLGGLVILFIVYFILRKQEKKKEEWVDVKEMAPSEQEKQPKIKEPEPTPRFCGNCGHKVESESRFCGSCGASLNT